MGKIDDLIMQYCPDGVEYKTLNEIATNWFRGNGIKRDEVFENGVPCVRYGELYTTYGLYFTECVSHTAADVLPNPKVAKKGSILFAITGESVEDISVSTAYLGEEDIYVGGDILVMEHEQNSKYVSYALSTTNSREQKSKGRVKSKVVHSNKESISNIVIPIPPLPVQEEIVRILDKFTELEQELEQELELRKKQYEYYRNILFNFDDSVEYKPLGGKNGVCDLVAGATPSKSNPEYWDNGTIPWMSSGEVNNKRIYHTDNKITQLGYENASTTLVPIHTVVIALAGQGKTRGKVAITEIELCTNQSLCSMVCHDGIDYRYLYYYLDGRYEDLRSISNGDGGRGGLSLRILSDYQVPVPSKEEQLRIVDILDKFSTLTSDISEGLPAEIKMRHQQYEYYRDKLLNFKRLEVAANA